MQVARKFADLRRRQVNQQSFREDECAFGFISKSAEDGASCIGVGEIGVNRLIAAVRWSIADCLRLMIEDLRKVDVNPSNGCRQLESPGAGVQASGEVDNCVNALVSDEIEQQLVNRGGAHDHCPCGRSRARNRAHDLLSALAREPARVRIAKDRIRTVRLPRAIKRDPSGCIGDVLEHECRKLHDVLTRCASLLHWQWSHMIKRLLLISSPMLLASCVTAVRPSDARGPRVAHHQHLISPAFAPIVKFDPIDAGALLRMLDETGTERAVVLSMGYSFSDERKKLENPELLTRQENDWTAAQVATAPSRLRGFCGVNPLAAGALEEIERCNALPGMRGLKLHFGNSGVSLRQPETVVRMRQVFALANRLRAPIVVHMRARSGTTYGAEDARLFIEQLLPVAPDIDIQVAHLAGAGPGFGSDADSAMSVFGQAIGRRDARASRLLFDATTVVAPDGSAEDGALVARRIREVGVDRVVFGSDLPISGNLRLAEAWQLFRTKVPLTSAEFARIAANVAPYLR